MLRSAVAEEAETRCTQHKGQNQGQDRWLLHQAFLARPSQHPVWCAWGQLPISCCDCASRVCSRRVVFLAVLFEVSGFLDDFVCAESFSGCYSLKKELFFVSLLFAVSGILGCFVCGEYFRGHFVCAECFFDVV